MATTYGTPTLSLQRPIQANDVGSVPSTTSGVTVEEIGGLGVARQTKFTFTDATITLLRTSSSIASGGLQIYDFPKGAIGIKTGSAKLSVAASGSSLTAAALVASVGTTVAGVDNGTLTTTEIDILPSTSAAMAASAATVAAGATTPTSLNGTATAKDAYLNFATSDDISSTRTLTVNGWVIVNWEHGGDATIA